MAQAVQGKRQSRARRQQNVLEIIGSLPKEQQNALIAAMESVQRNRKLYHR